MVGLSLRRKKSSIASAVERQAFEQERIKQARITGRAKAVEEAKRRRQSLKRRADAGSGSLAMGSKRIGMNLIQFAQDVNKAQTKQVGTSKKRRRKQIKKTRTIVIK